MSRPYAIDVLRSMAKKQAIVPAIFPPEVANGLLMGERRKRSTEADTTKWLQSLASLPIEVDSRQAPETFSSVVPLARAHGMTSYDASYLELALRRSIPIATMEPKLRACAKVLGVKLYQPKRTKGTKWNLAGCLGGDHQANSCLDAAQSPFDSAPAR